MPYCEVCARCTVWGACPYWRCMCAVLRGVCVPYFRGFAPRTVMCAPHTARCARTVLHGVRPPYCAVCAPSCTDLRTVLGGLCELDCAV